MPRDTVRTPGWAVIGGVLAALIGLFFLFAPYMSTQLWWGVRGGMFALIALVLVVLAVAYAALSKSMSAKAFAVVVALGAVGWFMVHAYLVDKEYTASIKVVTDGVPDLTERAPFNVAAEQARPNLGDSSGDIADTS